MIAWAIRGGMALVVFLVGKRKAKKFMEGIERNRRRIEERRNRLRWP